MFSESGPKGGVGMARSLFRYSIPTVPLPTLQPFSFTVGTSSCRRDSVSAWPPPLSVCSELSSAPHCQFLALWSPHWSPHPHPSEQERHPGSVLRRCPRAAAVEGVGFLPVGVQCVCKSEGTLPVGFVFLPGPPVCVSHALPAWRTVGVQCSAP